MVTKTKLSSYIVHAALGFLGLTLLTAALFSFFLFRDRTLIGGWAVDRDEEVLDCRDLNIHSSLGLMRLRDPQSMDLRGSQLRLRTVERLQQRFPACEIRWDVPIGSERFDSASLSVELTSLSPEDIEAFAFFDALQRVDAENCSDYEALSALEAARPELDVRWSVPLGKEHCAHDAVQLRLLAEDALYEELLENLGWFTALETLEVIGPGLSPAQQSSLMEAYPQIRFLWEVETVLGQYFSSGTQELSLAGYGGFSLDTLLERCALFPELKLIDLSGCGFSNEELLAFREALPGVDVRWSFKLFGAPVSTLDTEIDLSNCPIEDVQQVEDALFYFPYLEKVVMCDCGPSDEEMDALDKRYEDIRFVWMVHFGDFFLRTDATAFIATTFPYGYTYLTNEQLEPLRYCRDLIALDLGHMEYSDVSFLEDLPNLRWLIMADTRISDISMLANMKDLYYLELFQTNVRDISPLLECKNLRHLNLAYCYLDNGALLGEMTWLERLWLPGASLNGGYNAVMSLPNTKVELWCGSSTGGTWRTDPAYYEMRDIFGAYYMPG